MDTIKMIAYRAETSMANLLKDEKTDMVDYLDSFFREAGDERFVERNIAPTCR